VLYLILSDHPAAGETVTLLNLS